MLNKTKPRGTREGDEGDGDSELGDERRDERTKPKRPWSKKYCV